MRSRRPPQIFAQPIAASPRTPVTTRWTIPPVCFCSTPMGASSASSTFTRTGASPFPKSAEPSVERSFCQMIRSAFLILALASFAPLQAVADPPTAHLPAAFEATIAPGDTLDSVLGHAGIPATIRAEAALALSGDYDLTELRPGHLISGRSGHRLQKVPVRLL